MRSDQIKYYSFFNGIALANGKLIKRRTGYFISLTELKEQKDCFKTTGAR